MATFIVNMYIFNLEYVWKGEFLSCGSEPAPAPTPAPRPWPGLLATSSPLFDQLDPPTVEVVVVELVQGALHVTSGGELDNPGDFSFDV